LTLWSQKCYLQGVTAHSSSGLGHRPLKAEIRGSNPLCATNSSASLFEFGTPPNCAGFSVFGSRKSAANGTRVVRIEDPWGTPAAS
jgi:hypothetical protein